MTSATMTPLSTKNRIDFVFFFDVKDGNPNGDPDAGNAPRTDPETGQGLVSDVALKRKVRDYVAAAKGGTGGFKLYVKLHSSLYDQRLPAYEDQKLTKEKFEKLTSEEKQSAVEAARQWMCKNYFDVRAFGAVMSVKEFNCGQVRGPLQVTFARSIDPIADLEQTIVRKAVEKDDAEKQLKGSKENPGGQITGTIGRKSLVPYGLYRAHVFFNPHFAGGTGFGDQDLELVVEALKGMFDLDRSATRGQMSARALLAFVHSSSLGNAPAATLFDRVTASLRDSSRPPRQFQDYELSVDDSQLPQGVSLLKLL